MNWDNQLSSILSVADDSVAKMRERLTSPGKFSEEQKDLFPVRESVLDLDLDPLAQSLQAHPYLLSPALTSGVQWADLAAIQSQLQIQSQVIETLSQKLRFLETEKRSQQHHIQTLQEKVHSLQEELKTRQMEDMRIGQSPGVERGMEQWRREAGSLRGHITQATTFNNLQDSLNSKHHREELEHLWKEVDQLKTRLKRQEEDTYLQLKEARETRRQYERSCKELTDGCRTHSSDLVKTLSQYAHTQQEIHQIRTQVSELKAEVRSLILRGQEPTSLLSAHTSAAPLPPVPHGRNKVFRREEAESDSEDFSPTPSLTEISSDDLSWLDDKEPALQRLSVQSRPSRFAAPGSDVEDHDDSDGDGLLDDDVDNSELGSDLSLNDL